MGRSWTCRNEGLYPAEIWWGSLDITKKNVYTYIYNYICIIKFYYMYIYIYQWTRGETQDFFQLDFTNNYEEIPWEFALDVWDSGIVFMVNSHQQPISNPYISQRIFHLYQTRIRSRKSLSSLTRIIVSRGNDPQMAARFRLVKYYNLPIYIYIWLGL